MAIGTDQKKPTKPTHQINGRRRNEQENKTVSQVVDSNEIIYIYTVKAWWFVTLYEISGVPLTELNMTVNPVGWRGTPLWILLATQS